MKDLEKTLNWLKKINDNLKGITAEFNKIGGLLSDLKKKSNSILEEMKKSEEKTKQ